MRKITFSALFFMVLVSCSNQESKKLADNNAIDSINFDKTVSPGSDFYHYANGGWLKNNEIPGEFSSYGVFEMLYEENTKTLREIMENAVKDKNAVKGSDQQKIGDFYASGMDTLIIEKAGFTPLKPYLDMVTKIKTTKEIPSILAQLHYTGVSALFGFFASQDDKNSEMVIGYTYQGGINLPEKDYYISKDPQSEMLRAAYINHIASMFKLVGKSEADAKKIATKVLSFETQLAEASKSMGELRDPIGNYNKIKIEALQKITPEFDWTVYLKELEVDPSCDINVGQQKFFEAINKMMKQTPVDQWKDYLTWSIINSNASYLSKAFVDERFNFYGKILSGTTQQQARWKKMVSATSSSLGEIVGKAYVEKNFPPEAKTRMIDLVKNLKKSFAQRLEQLSWMTPETKKKAQEKLEAMGLKIGYPDNWRDYSSLEISKDNFFNNVINCSKLETKFMLSKIGKPVDRAAWEMTPQTINAYFSPTRNEIVFPAAILQAPFFFLDGDDAVNYGAIGVIIGHEMTHGFDDQGRLYDKNGNLNDWWTAEDAKKFKETTSVLVDQFNNFTILDSLHVNGEVTLGENIADLGGITISHNALKMAGKQDSKIRNLSQDQRFYLSFAQIWRTNMRPEYLQMLLKMDVHSPAIARVNGVVYNVPEFYIAFNIKETDKMYRKPENRAVVW